MKKLKKGLLMIFTLVIIIVGGVAYTIHHFDNEIKLEKKDQCTFEVVAYLADLVNVMQKMEGEGIEVNFDFKMEVTNYTNMVIDYVKKRIKSENSNLHNAYYYADLIQICQYFKSDDKEKYIKLLEQKYDGELGAYIVEQDATKEENIEDTCLLIKELIYIYGILNPEVKIQKIKEYYKINRETTAKATLFSFYLDMDQLDKDIYKEVEEFELDCYQKEIQQYLNGRKKKYTLSDLENNIEECANLFSWEQELKDYNKNIYINLLSEEEFDIDITSKDMCSNLASGLSELKKGIAENDFLVENINKWLQDNYEILVKEEFFNMHL